MKGEALVRTPSSSLRQAEVHWYEAHGIGKRDFKIKRYLDRGTGTAFRNACEALDLHLESLQKLHLPLPEPKHRLVVQV
jgi:hypothetical protein